MSLGDYTFKTYSCGLEQLLCHKLETSGLTDNLPQHWRLRERGLLTTQLSGKVRK
jgi:hypothetical protein